ncbi:MAG: cytochrome c [Chthonomonas sp.]|nr:cytochrome c [Chthonomonas sp.]
MNAKHGLLIGAAAVMLAGCHTDMWTQPKVTTYKESEMFEDGKSARPLEAGVVARGHLKTDKARFQGRDAAGGFVTAMPETLTIWNKKVSTSKDLKVVLKHGQERFDIYCSHCHGKLGDGNGMITQRGLVLRRKPASYHDDRLRKMPIGYFYHVMTDGFGTMFAQAPRVSVDDRWAIAAYIRVLQASQDVDPNSLTPEERAMVDKKEEAATHAEGEGH